MGSKPRLRKDPKLSHSPSTLLVYKSHEYGSRDHLGRPSDPRLPPNFGKTPRGVLTHFLNLRHSSGGGLTVCQVLSDGGPSAPGGERAERSSFPLNAYSALRKPTLEPRHIPGGPLGGELGGGLLEALAETYSGCACTDCDAQYPQD